MSLTTKGKKRIAKGVTAYMRAGAKIAAEVPLKACEAFFESPPRPESAGRNAWQTALKRITDKDVAMLVDSAHGYGLSDIAEEAFMTGLFAGLTLAKVAR